MNGGGQIPLRYQVEVLAEVDSKYRKPTGVELCQFLGASVALDYFLPKARLPLEVCVERPQGTRIGTRRVKRTHCEVLEFRISHDRYVALVRPPGITNHT